MTYSISIQRVTPRPLATVRERMTPHEVPSRFRPLLGQVYTAAKGGAIALASLQARPTGGPRATRAPAPVTASPHRGLSRYRLPALAPVHLLPRTTWRTPSKGRAQHVLDT